MRIRQVGILVLLVWIVGSNAAFRSERELGDYVLNAIRVFRVIGIMTVVAHLSTLGLCALHSLTRKTVPA
jgi:hypothetical protein